MHPDRSFSKCHRSGVKDRQPGASGIPQYLINPETVEGERGRGAACDASGAARTPIGLRYPIIAYRRGSMTKLKGAFDGGDKPPSAVAASCHG
jgi:hypothetical protein